MDKKDNEMTNEFTTNSTRISKDKCEAIKQNEYENLTQMESVQPENNNFVSLIQASRGKRKFNFLSDGESSSEQFGNPSSVPLGSNLSCSINKVHLNKPTSFKRLSKKSKCCFRSKRRIPIGYNGKANANGRIVEDINTESNVPTLVHAASDEDSEISSEEDRKHLLNENSKGFLGSEEAIKNAAFGPNNFFYYPKSDIISGMDYEDGQISSLVALPNCCWNEESEENAVETLNIRDNATAEDAGPSGCMPGKGNERKFACSLCHKEFAESWEFDAHYETHKKAFVCDVCQKIFFKKAALDRHYRTHTGEKIFVCDVCNKGFSQIEHLNSHSIIHTGEKPYVCDVCNKGFTQKGSLNTHYRIHTGEKPYVCDVCNEGFSHKGSLNRHSIIHTGEKPFVCEICTKNLADEKDLEKHARKHTGKLFECNICGKSYLNISSLRRHYKEKH